MKKHILKLFSMLLCVIVAFSGLQMQALASSAPKAPTISVSTGDSSFTVSWGKVSGATAYKIYYTTDSKFKKNVKTTTTTSTKKTVKNLKSYTKYYIRVKTCSGKKKKPASSYSSTKYVITNVRPTYIKSVTAGEASFTVSLGTASGCKYQIQYATNTNFTGAKTVNCGTSATVKKLGNSTGKPVTYYVRARTYRANSSKKNVYTAWTDCKKVTTKQVTFPKTPRVDEVSTALSAGTASVTFDFFNYDGKTTAYKVQLSTDNTFKNNIKNSGSVSSSKVTIDGLNQNTVYYYKIQAVRNLNGVEYVTSWTTPKNNIFKTPASVASDAPQNVTLTLSNENKRCNVTWNSISKYSNVSYTVQYSTTADFSSESYATSTQMLSDTKTHFDCEYDNQYFVRVCANITIDGVIYTTPWSGTQIVLSTKPDRTGINALATKTMYSYQGGIKYASSPIYEKFYDGLNDDDKKRNIANTGLFDIMPIEALGLNVGDTITIRNDSPTYRYTCVFGNEYMNKVANVPWIYPAKETTFTIPETAVGLGLSATIDYNKEFLPKELDLNNLHIYKADGEEVDFLSLLAKYAVEDETPASLNKYPSLGHNFDTQFEQKLAQQFGLAMIDVDTVFTKDNVALNTHTLNVTINGETKKVSDVTYQELIDNGYSFRLIDDVLNDVDVNKITLYLDLKQETTTSAKQIVDYIEQHNLDTKCFVGNLYVKILSYIHTLNPNISLWCYESVDSEWTEENIEALKSLKGNNMIAISVNSKGNDFNKIKDFAKEFDIVSSNIVTAASESQTKVINLRDIVEYYNTNPGNCICSANVGAVVRNDLLYLRWKNTFAK